jgi:hypothetical protein
MLMNENTFLFKKGVSFEEKANRKLFGYFQPIFFFKQLFAPSDRPQL